MFSFWDKTVGFGVKETKKKNGGEIGNGQDGEGISKIIVIKV